MESLFLQILNMSITASWIVLAVCLLRLILKKAPKWVSVALWGLVGFRLVCPFSFESVLSLLPSAQTVPTDIAMTAEPAIHSGIPALNSTINPILSDSFAPNPGDSANPLQVVTFVLSMLWIVGMAAMLLYMAISYIRLHKKTRESIVLADNVFVCDRIDTPFILGLFRPRIFLPSGMDESDINHVLAHENAHLQRHDHWWKPLGFLLLTVHWFNPVLWLGYILLCRDIELACDEKVIRNMDVQNKKDYSSALINCSVSRKSIAACPLAFGEVGVKSRIKTVLHYKKPTLWILILALLASTAAAVCLLTNPVNKEIGGYEYRVSRYYHDNVIGKDRANREMGEYTFEIDEYLSTMRYINGNFHSHYTLVPVDGGTEKLLAAAESTLPAYYKLLNVEQVYFREGWDGALQEQGELNYFIIQYSNGSLIGGYLGANDEVPGQIYRLRRTEKLSEGKMRSTQKIEEWFDFTDSGIVEWGSVLRYEHPAFSDTVFEWKEGQIYAVRNGEEALLISGMPVLNAVFCDLTGDGLPELCTSVAFGSGMVDHRIAVYDFAEQCEYVLQDRGNFDYWLTVEDGQVYACKTPFPSDRTENSERGKLLFSADNEQKLQFSAITPSSHQQTRAAYYIGEKEHFSKEVGYDPKAYSVFVKNFAPFSVSPYSSVQYLPVASIASGKQLNFFVEQMSPYLNGLDELQQSYITENKTFFDDYVLLLCYYETKGVGSGFFTESILRQNDALAIVFGEAMLDWKLTKTTAWLLGLVMEKEDMQGIEKLTVQCNVHQFDHDTAIYEEPAATVTESKITSYYGHIDGIIRELREQPLHEKEGWRSQPILQISSIEEWNHFMDLLSDKVLEHLDPEKPKDEESKKQYITNLNAKRAEYDAAFFEENDLFITYIYESDASVQASFRHVAKTGQDGSVLTVYLARYSPHIITEISFHYAAFVAVAKEEAACITDCEAYFVETIYH